MVQRAITFRWEINPLRVIPPSPRRALARPVLVPFTRALVSSPAEMVTNRIVLENQLPGSPSTEWDVNGAGTQDIQGFATRASLQPGQTVSFKVRLAKPEPFRIDIYRLGYYGGAGARKIGSAVLVSIAHTLAARQPDCLREDEGAEVPTQLVDCGNWAVVASFAIPSNATTGLYFGRATLLTPNDNWRTDDSPKRFDPSHAMVGRDPLLPPDGSLPHAYGAAGRNRPRNALAMPRASHIWFVVREPPSTAAEGPGPDRDLLPPRGQHSGLIVVIQTNKKKPP